MRIGVIGVGAVGGYFGSLLVRGGCDVHFLLKNDFCHVRDNGLKVDSKNGNFLVYPVNAYGNDSTMPVCDMVIIALKTPQNYVLRSILPEILKKNGMVVALQNGLHIEEELSEIVPNATIIGGLCFLCGSKAGPGHIRHLDYGSIRLGAFQKNQPAVGITPALHSAAEIFIRAGIPVRLAENLGKARWEKLVWNMGFNGPAVVLNATTGRIMRNASARQMVQEVMDEVICGAQSCGFDIDAGFAGLMMDATRKMVDYSPSMKCDHEAQRPMEVDSIYWRPIRAAAEKGFDMGRSKMLAYELDFLDNSLKEKFQSQVAGAV